MTCKQVVLNLRKILKIDKFSGSTCPDINSLNPLLSLSHKLKTNYCTQCHIIASFDVKDLSNHLYPIAVAMCAV